MSEKPIADSRDNEKKAPEKSGEESLADLKEVKFDELPGATPQSAIHLSEEQREELKANWLRGEAKREPEAYRSERQQERADEEIIPDPMLVDASAHLAEVNKAQTGMSSANDGAVWVKLPEPEDTLLDRGVTYDTYQVFTFGSYYGAPKNSGYWMSQPDGSAVEVMPPFSPIRRR